MPPKVDPDVKLNQLRSYVASNVRQLASTGKTSLKGILFAKRTIEEAGFYWFLWSSEHAFTDVQRAHADETLALVTQHSVNSGDAHPAEGGHTTIEQTSPHMPQASCHPTSCDRGDRLNEGGKLPG